MCYFMFQRFSGNGFQAFARNRRLFCSERMYGLFADQHCQLNPCQRSPAVAIKKPHRTEHRLSPHKKVVFTNIFPQWDEALPHRGRVRLRWDSGCVES
jgi:hypothetical protein